MADGTVRGAFDLNVDQPLRGLRSIRTEGGRADAMMRQLGGTMDRMGGATANRKLEDYESRLRKVGTTADVTATKVGASWGVQRRTIESESDRIEFRVGRLESRIERYGRTRATARVELNGAEKVNAQLLALERRLAAFGRSRSTATVGSSGGFGGLASSASGVGGGGGGGGFGTAGKLALGGLALLPGAQGLLGGATALLGSASGAALGAGAVGIGAVGTLGTGGVLSGLVGKAAVKELQTLQKEQTKYNEIVRKYGEASKQAAIGRRELQNAERFAGPGAALATRQVSLTRQAYRAATAPGRQAFFGAAGNAAIAFRGAAPTFGRATNIASSATAGAITSLAGFATGEQSQRTVMALSQEFARDLPTIEHSLQNVLSTAEHLSLAARPFFHEATEWVQTWTHGLAASSSNEARVSTTMRGLVTETKDWGRLTGAAYRTLRDIFDLGRPSGDSMVVSLTTTLDRWDAWIQRNPQRVQAFFKEAETTTSGIASALTSVVHLISQAATALTPIFNRALPLVNLATSLGPGVTSAGGALLYGAYGGFRGGGGGGGSRAGAVLRTGLLGSPYRGGGRASAAMGGTGVVVGGGAARMLGEGVYNVRPRAVVTRGPNGFIAGPTAGRLAPSEIYAAANARDTGPFLSIAERPSAVSGLGGRIAGSRVGGAALGAGKTLGATVAIIAALEAAGKGGGPGAITQNFASSSTFGLIHPAPDPTGQRGAGWAQKFLSGIPSSMSPEASLAVIQRKIARDLNRPFATNTGFSEQFGHTGTPLSERYAGGRVNPNSANFATQVGSQLKALEAQPGGHTRNVVTEIKELQTAWKAAKEEAAAYRKARNEALDFKSVQHGEHISAQLGSAFKLETGKGRSTRAAFGDVTGGALSAMKQMRDAGAKVLGENTLAWAHQLEKGNPALKGPVDKLTAQIAARFRKLGTDVQIVNGHILTGSTEQWQAISTAMSEPIEQARERMQKAFTAIQNEAVGALVAMGFSSKSARAAVAGQEAGKGSALNTVGTAATGGGIAGRNTSGVKRARGGMIGGAGLLDTVPVPGGMAAPGEAWIANRHTLAALTSATVAKYGLTAQQMISSETRPHSMPVRHATGGYYPGPQGRTDQGVDFAGPGPVKAVLPGTVRSTGLWPGWPGTGGIVYDTARGPVYVMEDFAPAVRVGQSLRQGQVIGQDMGGAYGIETGWANSSGTGPLVRYNGLKDGTPTTGGAAFARFLGTGGGGGAVGAAGATVARRISLHGRRSGLAGVPGLLADRGSARYASALESRVNGRLNTAGGGAIPGASSKGGAPSANEALGRQMMLAAGWPASEWPSLKALWTQESGWNANSVNSSSGAYGIPQALGHGHPFNLGDAGAQIAWGLNYIRGRYGSPAGAEAHERAFNWYQRGGRAAWGGWNAAGGNFETRGPTVFGAGEGGKRERVSITPIGQGAPKGGHNITVEIGHVTMSSDADVEKVAREVAARILDELDAHGQTGSERELIGR